MKNFVRSLGVAQRLALLSLVAFSNLPAQTVSFIARRDFDVGQRPTSVAVSDFNGDGFADLAVANSGSDDISVLLGNGDGTFRVAVNYATDSSPVSVAVGDFNGDGIPDLAVAGPSMLSVLLGNGDGTFQQARPIVLGGSPSYVSPSYNIYSPFFLAVGDFNEDGLQDLAMAVANFGFVAVFLSNGDGTFRNSANLSIGGYTQSIAVADLDADGHQDLAVACAGDLDVRCVAGDLGRGGVAVLLGNGDGTFQAARPVQSGIVPVSVAVGDFNGDGRPDLAVADLSPLAWVLLGNGDGTFRAAMNFNVGGLPDSIAVGDFNGDGFQDLAVANFGSEDVSVLLGNGDGTFQAAVNYAADVGPTDVAVGDFNGDGVPDLAVTNVGSGTISILLGKGNGTFRPPANFAPAGFRIAVGDFNGDGIPDLVTEGFVLLGNGDGTFQPPLRFVAGTHPVSIAVGDFNGDGRLDLAVGNEDSDNVSVLLGNGDGTFQAAANFSVGKTPQSIVVDDFDADGHQDIAVAYIGNPDRGGVSVLMGRGDGTFQPAINYPAGLWPFSLAVGDFDGDGKLDLAVADDGTYNLVVLLGNGDGTFRPPANFFGPFGEIAVGDFNDDGKPDLVVVNGGDGVRSYLAVLINNTPSERVRSLDPLPFGRANK